MLIASQLIQVLVPILVTLLLGLAVPGDRLLLQKLGQGRMSEVEGIVRFVVGAAEQAGRVDEIRTTGQSKKAWALSEVQRRLDERGLKGISADTLSTMIEAAVFDTINRYRAGELVALEGEPIVFSRSAPPCPNENCPYHAPAPAL